MFNFISELFGGLGSIWGSSLEAFERDIEANIDYLKQEQWFRAYLADDTYEQLITKNKRVRRIIGLVNTRKLSSPAYHDKQRAKIDKVIEIQIR